MTTFINVADIRDPDDPEGRTYRQVKKHNIPIGALVQLESGVRLFVVHHSRDCNKEPLYYLSIDKSDTVQRDLALKNTSWHGGYSESSLVVVDTNLFTMNLYRLDVKSNKFPLISSHSHITVEQGNEIIHKAALEESERIGGRADIKQTSGVYYGATIAVSGVPVAMYYSYWGKEVARRTS